MFVVNNKNDVTTTFFRDIHGYGTLLDIGVPLETRDHGHQSHIHSIFSVHPFVEQLSLSMDIYLF